MSAAKACSSPGPGRARSRSVKSVHLHTTTPHPRGNSSLNCRRRLGVSTAADDTQPRPQEDTHDFRRLPSTRARRPSAGCSCWPSIASLMVALDVLVVSTALGTIRHDLGASIDELEWTVNAYSLSFAVLLITASVLGDRLGRRRLFAGGLGAVRRPPRPLCALAPNIGTADRRPGAAGRGARRSSRRCRCRCSPPPSRPTGAARRWVSTAASPAWPCSAGRCSAARSPRGWPGSSCSGSTCRSGWSRSRSS